MENKEEKLLPDNPADTTLYDQYIRAMMVARKNIPITKEIIASLPLGFSRTAVFPNRSQRSLMKRK
jgi:hypothetical protein